MTSKCTYLLFINQQNALDLTNTIKSYDYPHFKINNLFEISKYRYSKTKKKATINF